MHHNSALKKSDEFLKSDFLAVVKHRDSLQLALDRFEAHMTQMQATVRVLQKERDNALSETYNVRQELDQLRSVVVSNGLEDKVSNSDNKSAKDKSLTDVVLKKVEEERDAAIETSRIAMNDKDSLLVWVGIFLKTKKQR